MQASNLTPDPIPRPDSVSIGVPVQKGINPAQAQQLSKIFDGIGFEALVPNNDGVVTFPLKSGYLVDVRLEPEEYAPPYVKEGAIRAKLIANQEAIERNLPKFSDGLIVSMSFQDNHVVGTKISDEYLRHQQQDIEELSQIARNPGEGIAALTRDFKSYSHEFLKAIGKPNIDTDTALHSLGQMKWPLAAMSQNGYDLPKVYDELKYLMRFMDLESQLEKLHQEATTEQKNRAAQMDAIALHDRLMEIHNAKNAGTLSPIGMATPRTQGPSVQTSPSALPAPGFPSGDAAIAAAAAQAHHTNGAGFQELPWDQLDDDVVLTGTNVGQTGAKTANAKPAGKIINSDEEFGPAPMPPATPGQPPPIPPRESLPGSPRQKPMMDEE
jgi:hypothetical protein